MFKSPACFFGLGFGAGLAPIAPGTIGSLVAIPLLISISTWTSLFYVVFVLAVILVGIKICERAASDIGEHDHSGIVWDEIAGMLITFLFVPICITTLIIGFILFRIFDILKPWPIAQIDKNMKGGLGIMADDIVAGLMSAISLWGIHLLI